MAKLCDVTPQAVINWVTRGDLAARRIGRGPRRIPAEAAAAFLRKNSYPVPEWLERK